MTSINPTDDDRDSDYDLHPDTIDPVRFYLVNEYDQIIGCGASFPFPHDAIVVSQGNMTTTLTDLTDVKHMPEVDRIEFLEGDLSSHVNEREWCKVR